MKPKSRFKISKYEGDDAYSWALFQDNKPIMTGLNRRMADYYLRLERNKESNAAKINQKI